MFQRQSNEDILKLLNFTVVGHFEAKKKLISAVNRARIYYYRRWVIGSEPYPHKTNLMLIGESGTGKTFMVKELCRIIKVPFFYVDTTKLVPSGAGSGGISALKLSERLEEFVNEYLNTHQSEYYSKEGVKAQTIIFLDEFDKLSSHYDGSDGEWNRHTQTHILQMLESWSESSIVIFAGAFSGLDKTRNEKTIGFNRQTISSQSKDLEESVMEYGFIPEIMGRMGVIAELDKFQLKDYIYILQHHIIPEFFELASMYNFKYSLKHNEIKRIAEVAMKSGQGVRNLRQIINKKFLIEEFNHEYKSQASASPTY